MKLPEKYSHLSYEQKKKFMEKLIELHWDENIEQLINNEEFWNDNVEFLFSYIFSDKEQRSKTRDELTRKYNVSENLLQWYIQKLYKLNIEANEFKSDLKDEDDIESLENQILSL